MSNPNDGDIEKGTTDLAGKNGANIVQHKGPCKLYCPSCKKSVVSEIVESDVDFSWIHFFSLCYICCHCCRCCACCRIIPFCWPVAKDTEHVCDECGDLLGVKKANFDFCMRPDDS